MCCDIGRVEDPALDRTSIMDTSALDLLATVATEASENEVTYSVGSQVERLKHLAKIAAQRRYDQERYEGSEGDRIREKRRETSKREADKIKRRARQRNLYARNTEKFKAKDKAFKERRNADPVRKEAATAVKREWERKKRETDIEFRVRVTLRSRVKMAVAAQGTGKSKKTMELVGCTVAEVRAHLESQFKDGMSWDNFGEWHIDHIRPLVSFDLKDPEQQKIAFHKSNMQPLWASENWSKGGKLDWEPKQS